MGINISHLNSAQMAGVLITEGPLLVVAGAGTGKTRVLTYRIARIIDLGLAKPHEILAVTFTNKAAAEMKERLIHILGNSGHGVWCSTFHSMCVRLLRADAEKIGYTSNFTIYDTDDVKRILKGLLKKHKIDDKEIKIGSLASVISQAKNNMTTPDPFESRVSELASDLWDEYHYILKQNNAMDFDSLLNEAVRLLEEHPDVLIKYQERFKYILADEQQDVNLPQNILLTLLAGKRRNIMVVGDEDQCHPPNTKITTPLGHRLITDLMPGDSIVAAGGSSRVIKDNIVAIKKTEFLGDLIEVNTTNNIKTSLTKNHPLFFRLDDSFDARHVFIIKSIYNKWYTVVINGAEVRYGDVIWPRWCNGSAWLIKTLKINDPEIDEIIINTTRACTNNTVKEFLNSKNILLDTPLFYGINENKSQIVLKSFALENKEKARPNKHILQLNQTNTYFQSYTNAKNVFNQSILENNNTYCKETFSFMKNLYYFKINAEELRPGMIVVGNNEEESGGKLIELYVSKIERVPYSGFVYGLETKKAHNYIANQFLVSNCIYTFRASSPQYIMNFEKTWPEAMVIKLEENYRSTGNILTAANGLISHNRNRREKTLFTKNPLGEKVIGYVANNDKDESWFIVRSIEKLIKSKNLKHSDFAILYRTHAQSRGIEDAFLRAGIPYKIIGGTRYFERMEVKDLMAYMRVIVNPADEVALKRIINTPRRGIGPKAISKIEQLMNKNSCTFWDALSLSITTKEISLSQKIKIEIQTFLNIMKNIKQVSKTLPVSEVVEYIIENTGILTPYELDKTDESLGRIENIKEMLSVAKDYLETSHSQDDDGIKGFVEWLSLRSDLDEADKSTDSVLLMTAHTAKGLEFPVVFVVGLEEGIFPHSNSLWSEDGIEEERRLTYVAYSRAKIQLFLIRSIQRMMFGRIIMNKPSRFLNETPDDCLENANAFKNNTQSLGNYKTKTNNSGEITQEKHRHDFNHLKYGKYQDFNSQSKLNILPIEEYKIGDKVEHKIFGRGTVISEKTNIIVVRFDGIEKPKTLVPNYAPIKKINSG